LVAQGFKNEKVTHMLDLKLKTVESHLNRIYRKTGLTREGLIAATPESSRFEERTQQIMALWMAYASARTERDLPHWEKTLAGVEFVIRSLDARILARVDFERRLAEISVKLNAIKAETS